MLTLTLTLTQAQPTRMCMCCTLHGGMSDDIAQTFIWGPRNALAPSSFVLAGQHHHQQRSAVSGDPASPACTERDRTPQCLSLHPRCAMSDDDDEVLLLPWERVGGLGQLEAMTYERLGLG